MHVSSFFLSGSLFLTDSVLIDFARIVQTTTESIHPGAEIVN